MKYLRWALLWPVLFFVGIFGRICSPIVCCFIVTKPRLDVVKRLAKIRITLNRDYLVWWLCWFDTDDNATDEYWYGLYDKNSTKTQKYYDTHKIFRWWCRVRWLNRNSMYTFNRKFFGLEKSSKWAWQITKKIPIGFGYYNSINIGYKAHKGFEKLMYAGGIIRLKKY